MDHSAPQSSNQPSINLPYQRWFRFKEAYSPKLVTDVVDSLDNFPNVVVDPFGGCGTTAITCQFLGITPTVIEVNPFLADLTEAKLTHYDLVKLAEDRRNLLDNLDDINISELERQNYPPTFCEPGIKNRWLYSTKLFKRILQYRYGIELLTCEKNKRLFRVILGSTLVSVSNVFINGKGRKYKANWKERQSSSYDLDFLFSANLTEALKDIRIFNQKHSEYKIIRGDCRQKFNMVDTFDLSIFSPPYPNSFDYTDVYNIELWMLGYITSNNNCQKLRSETLRSHVQVSRSYENTHANSEKLSKLIKELDYIRDSLWSKSIPDMVGAYFCDLASLLNQMRKKINENGNIIIVVGDSAYQSIRIPVADILEELADNLGYRTKEKRVIRKLRTSAQQGGSCSLDETLLWIEPC